MKYSLALGMPPRPASSAACTICSWVRRLLITSRMRWLPASGARVIVLRAAAHQRFDQERADAVDAQRRQRHLGAGLQHARQQLLELRVVGRRRRDQADALAELQAVLDALHQMVDVAMAHGQRGIPRQAEAAAARAAARHLEQEHVAELDVGD